MRTLLIDGNEITYRASLLDIRDLRAGIRKPSTVLPSLERVEMPSVSTEEWNNREYVEFICNRARNERMYNSARVATGGRTVKAYGYLQKLSGFRAGVAALVEGHMYIIPMADAIEYTLGLVSRAGLMRRMEVREPALRNLDHLGITNYLIIV